MTGQLLRAAGITVTAVTVTDLGPGVTATRVDIAGPGGTRQVTARLADGLALALISGAPLAVDGPADGPARQRLTGPRPAQPVPQRPAGTPLAAGKTVQPRNLGVHRRPAPMAPTAPSCAR